MRFLIILVSAMLALFFITEARTRKCPSCARGWAIWPVEGRLRRKLRVCHRCWKTHRAVAARRAER